MFFSDFFLRPNTRIINSIINEKLTKIDRYQNDYLLLKLDNGESSFIFPSKVKKDKWTQFQEGKSYEFTVSEGTNGSNLLVDFVGEEGGVFI